ncbi:hydantoin racemase [Saccharothrix sp. NRRL B-16348]|uniref:aspartate/glutamate racemase family protein n=1 Tax=Saccharothrix sp. NRRL B-16348 TaxID=1415542 RepID=UPI0006ADC41A|nr:aspartate/glutamate racemase family protein [Saccharothrix sp. NRRL B-16348]KOX30095.1 hydantoin racemase [Saccharothrix sp. NRRL B-16348]
MRIWFHKHTVEGRLPLLDDWYRKHLAEVASPGTTIDIKTLPEDTYGDATPFDLVKFGALQIHFNAYFAQSAVVAEREGYDAWVIAAGQDPGLHDARAMTSIPTLGYGETAFFYSALMGYRFGVLGFMPALREIISENIERYGIGNRLSSYEMAADGHEAVRLAVNGDFDLFLDAYGAAAQRAAEAGAQLLIPAEGIPTEIFWHLGVKELHGLPLIDPAGLLVRMTELTVDAQRLGITSRSGAGYWFRRPDDRLTEHIENVFLGSTIGKVA